MTPIPTNELEAILAAEPVAWRYRSSAPSAKWHVQKNRPAGLEKWGGYTVEPLYSAALVSELLERRKADEWHDISAQAYQEGREAMREEAAAEMEKLAWPGLLSRIYRSAAATIRALPTTPSPKPEEG